MESRNITLTLVKAKEWYKQGGELKEVALQAYKEEELTKNELPKTWEEYCEKINQFTSRKETYFIITQSEILKVPENQRRALNTKNGLSSIESAQAHIALMQLHQLRDCYRQGWVPDWNNNEVKFAIRFVINDFTIEKFIHISNFFSFPTEELAKEFLTNFRDLFEQVKYLIY